MGTLSLGDPLVLFEKSRLWASTGFHRLLSFHYHPTQHNNITHTVTLTGILTSKLPPVNNTDAHLTRNVVCPSGSWFENRPHLTPSIHLAWNAKHVIVQSVGIGTHIIAYSILKKHRTPLDVLCCWWRLPWHSADLRFRETRSCVPAWCSGP